MSEYEILSNHSLTREEIAEKLGYSVATITRRRKKLGISLPKGKKPGKSTGYRKLRIEKLCEGCNQKMLIMQTQLDSKNYCSRSCMFKSESFKQKLREVDRSYQHNENWSSWLRKDDLREYKKYRGKVNRMSEKTYVEHIDIINPNRHPRTISGVDGGYQLDHIKPVRQCFEEGISIQEASSLDNLRMLPWRDNIMRNKRGHIL